MKKALFFIGIILLISGNVSAAEPGFVTKFGKFLDGDEKECPVCPVNICSDVEMPVIENADNYLLNEYSEALHAVGGVISRTLASPSLSVSPQEVKMNFGKMRAVLDKFESIFVADK